MAEQESLYLWSTTALTNETADPAVGWAENQLPSTVNNSARAMMAAVARFVKDTDGSLTTAGSANAYTLTINGRQTPLATGHRLSFKASFANTAAATLAVTNADAVALGAKAVRGQGDVALAAGSIISGGRYDVEYDTAANSAAGAWILLNSGTVPTGFGVLATNYATPDVSSAGVPAANTAGLLAAFAASPYVNLGGRTFYVESIAIPVTAKRLFNGTLIAAGSYSASTAVVSATSNAAGLVIEDLTVTVDVGSYPTVNGIALIGCTNATVQRCTPTGLFAIFLAGRNVSARILNNTFSGYYGRAVWDTCDGGAASIFTVTSASPGVFTKTAHGLAVNDTVILYTTGALYTGLTMGELVYIKTVPTANTFTASLTLGGAAINTSGSQSGTHYYTSNGSVGTLIAGNEVFKIMADAPLASTGLITTGAYGAIISWNKIHGTRQWGAATTLGSGCIIDGNSVNNTDAEGVTTSSGVGAILSNNTLKFDATHIDTGISLSNSDGPPSWNSAVIGNIIENAHSGAILAGTGMKTAYVCGNNILSPNAGATTLVAGITLDGSTTTGNFIGQNSFGGNLANVQYQVSEGNFTGGGAPSGNFISQQIGASGTVGLVNPSATTQRAIIGQSSSTSTSIYNGFRFEGTPFAMRDVGGTNVGLYDYDGTLVGTLGSSGTPSSNWGHATHKWSSQGYGSVFASLTSAGWNWTNVAAPSTPASGTTAVYVDSTTKRLCSKNDAGIVTTTGPSLGALALRANRSASQTPSAGTWTKIQLNVEASDPNGWFDNATNYRLQPTVACVLILVGSTNVNVGVTSYGGVAIYKNGTEYNKYLIPTTAASDMQVSVPALVSFNGSSDYVELFGFSSGASPSFAGGAEITKLDAYQLY